MRREGRSFYIQWGGKDERTDVGWPGLAVRFVVNIAALWLSQAIIPGFDIEGWAALLFGAAIFGVINAFIRPVVQLLSCPLTLITLGLFTLIINAAMLGLTALIAGLFDLDFDVDGFIAAFLGALIISLVSTVLSRWADKNVLDPIRRERGGL